MLALLAAIAPQSISDAIPHDGADPFVRLMVLRQPDVLIGASHAPRETARAALMTQWSEHDVGAALLIRCDESRAWILDVLLADEAGWLPCYRPALAADALWLVSQQAFAPLLRVCAKGIVPEERGFASSWQWGGGFFPFSCIGARGGRPDAPRRQPLAVPSRSTLVLPREIRAAPARKETSDVWLAERLAAMAITHRLPVAPLSTMLGITRAQADKWLQNGSLPAHVDTQVLGLVHNIAARLEHRFVHDSQAIATGFEQLVRSAQDTAATQGHKDDAQLVQVLPGETRGTLASDIGVLRDLRKRIDTLPAPKVKMYRTDHNAARRP